MSAFSKVRVIEDDNGCLYAHLDDLIVATEALGDELARPGHPVRTLGLPTLSVGDGVTAGVYAVTDYLRTLRRHG